jgi:hypothetical protein
MKATIKNQNGMSLAAAVWLAHDTYDNGASAAPEQDTISVTTLLKPTRAFILAQQVDPNDESQMLDVTDMIPSRLGHAIHDSIEDAWRNGYRNSMAKLGYPQKAIDAVRINPETDDGTIFPVYLEQRFFREIDGVIISGKFDQIINGDLVDTKSTSVWAYMNGSKLEDYILQLSIYRWINPDKVTSDVAYIQHVFTDWQRNQVGTNPNYPKYRVTEIKVELMTIGQTERWIRTKLADIRKNGPLKQEFMVRCTDKELWKSEPQYKYYADPAKAELGGRSTKNFDSFHAADKHRKDAGKGVVVTKPGEVKACPYCKAFSVCEQKDEYFDVAA